MNHETVPRDLKGDMSETKFYCGNKLFIVFSF